MKNVSYKKLLATILAPFFIIFSIWLIIGSKYDYALITFFNSIITSLIISLGFATLCSWWFSLTRSSSIKYPLALSLTLSFIILISGFLLSIESMQPPGLYTPLAIFLNNFLESFTILLSLIFVILVGIFITKEMNTEEE